MSSYSIGTEAVTQTLSGHLENIYTHLTYNICIYLNWVKERTNIVYPKTLKFKKGNCNISMAVFDYNFGFSSVRNQQNEFYFKVITCLMLSHIFPVLHWLNCLFSCLSFIIYLFHSNFFLQGALLTLILCFRYFFHSISLKYLLRRYKSLIIFCFVCYFNTLCAELTHI